ncbi:MAG: hypothetical protein ABEJ75_00295 [Candidatus Nanohaloarchaea archaeon]
MGLVTEYYTTAALDQLEKALGPVEEASRVLEDSELKDWTDASLGFQYMEDEPVEYGSEPAEIEERMTLRSIAVSDRMYRISVPHRTKPITVSEDDLL